MPARILATSCVASRFAALPCVALPTECTDLCRLPEYKWHVANDDFRARSVIPSCPLDRSVRPLLLCRSIELQQQKQSRSQEKRQPRYACLAFRDFAEA